MKEIKECSHVFDTIKESVDFIIRMSSGDFTLAMPVGGNFHERVFGMQIEDKVYYAVEISGGNGKSMIEETWKIGNDNYSQFLSNERISDERAFFDYYQ